VPRRCSPITAHRGQVASCSPLLRLLLACALFGSR
jgi:hypothetical protein